MNRKLLLSTTLGTFLAINQGCSDSTTSDPTPDAAVTPDPAQLAIVTSIPKIPILHGTTATVEVTALRGPNADGAIVIEAVGLPPGVTFEPLTIDAGATTGTLTLNADAAAAHSLPTTVTIRATAGTLVASNEVTVTVTGRPGAVDTSFGGGKLVIPAGISDDAASAVAVQPDGKIVIAGRAAEHLGDFALIRLDRDGALDATFGTGGRVLTDFSNTSDTIHAIALQTDGKIVVVGTTTNNGSSNDFAVARYLPTGALDPSFGTGGKVVTVLGADSDNAYAVLIQPDGKIIVGGDSNRGTSQTGLDFALVRYTQAGALDASFGTAGVTLTPIVSRDSIYALAFQTVDGEQRILAAGGEGDFSVARYRASGALDTTFGTQGTVAHIHGSTIGAARAITMTPTGNIIVAGHSQEDIALAQLTAGGTLDPLFGNGGKVVTPVVTGFNEAQAIIIDTAGKLVIAGWAHEGMSTAGNFVAIRYLTNGALDPSFATGGIAITPVAAGTKADQAMALAIQQDDRVPTHRLIAAGFANVTNSDFAVTRYWR